ncbi:MAG: ABC transporter ATP-binding protein [Verrucomicrobia bacterium]|nr:ABC transporter ATP-binding protein [Verrucomicrobiota bacterium]
MSFEASSGIKVDAISFSYGAKDVLKDVSFAAPSGRFCALLGPNGAGKSTLISLLTGLFLPPKGTISIAGFDLSKHRHAALRNMGVVFQQQTLDLDLTVRQNLFYFAALHGYSSADVAKRITVVLERLGLGERAGERVRALNGGHRRRLEIARALLHQPKVLILDEPTVGLDAASRTAILDHVHRLCAEDGMAVLWTTHLVDEVRDDDLLVVLDEGKVLAQGPMIEVSKGRPLVAAFLEMTGAAAL